MTESVFVAALPLLIRPLSGHNLRLAFRNGYNLVVFHGDLQRTKHLLDPDKKERIIDVWWSNDAGTRLMLLFAYLMTRSDLWKHATIRV